MELLEDKDFPKRRLRLACPSGRAVISVFTALFLFAFTVFAISGDTDLSGDSIVLDLERLIDHLLGRTSLSHEDVVPNRTCSIALADLSFNVPGNANLLIVVLRTTPSRTLP